MGAAAVERRHDADRRRQRREVIAVPVTIVTKDNVDQFRAVQVRQAATGSRRPPPGPSRACGCRASARASARIEALRGRRSQPLPRRGAGPGRRQCRRQVDADQDPRRRLRARTPARSSSTAGACASPARPRRARQRSRWSTRTSRLCDTIDVAGNLFLGREPLRRGARASRCWTSARMHARGARAILRGLDIHDPATCEPGRPALRRPAPVDRDRARGAPSSPRS